MIISINARVMPGAWGGGNQAVKSIYDVLKRGNHTVINTLNHSKIDIILMIHPDKSLEITTYGIDEISDYLALNPRTLMIHRVNTSGDEHRGSGSEKDYLLLANEVADYTVFISAYLRDLFISNGFDEKRPHSVILNGADPTVFNSGSNHAIRPPKKWGIVTHHWSGNYMKGFDIYERLDQLLDTDPYRDLFEFTIIGNIPKGLKFKNTKLLAPLSGHDLSAQIRMNQIYLTASRNEGAGMHHIEGMLCGLPVLFLDSGALKEYCQPYGLEFNLVNFEAKLLELVESYASYKQKVLQCHYSSEIMGTQYLELCERLYGDQAKLPAKNVTLLDMLNVYCFNRPKRKICKVKRLVDKGFTVLKAMR